MQLDGTIMVSPVPPSVGGGQIVEAGIRRNDSHEEESSTQQELVHGRWRR